MAHDHHGPEHEDPHTAPLTETQLRVKALESLLTEKGLVDPRALLLRALALRPREARGRSWLPHARGARGARRRAAKGLTMPLLTAERVREVLRRGDRSRMDVDLPPKFKPGDRVRTRNIHPLGHTRLPRYARGHLGVVERDHGVFVFADASGRGLGKIPQHVYAVRFTARELWGADASPRDAIYVDLCDDHLDPT
jgi:nitrile hydratase